MISQEYRNFMFPISFKKSLKCLISKIVEVFCWKSERIILIQIVFTFLEKRAFHLLRFRLNFMTFGNRKLSVC